jgi:copper(I)-binding protein
MRNLLGAFMVVAAVSGCQQAPADPAASGAWVRLPAVAGNPGAAYFTVKGGSTPAILVAVSAPFAIRAELHESMAGHQGMASMQPIKDVAVPKGGAVEFKPGGKHVMLYDLAPEAKSGTRAPLTLSFADGRKVTVQAVIVGAGDPEPR